MKAAKLQQLARYFMISTLFSPVLMSLEAVLLVYLCFPHGRKRAGCERWNLTGRILAENFISKTLNKLTFPAIQPSFMITTHENLPLTVIQQWNQEENEFVASDLTNGATNDLSTSWHVKFWVQNIFISALKTHAQPIIRCLFPQKPID